MTDGQLTGEVVVAGDERGVDAADVPVDHHHRQPALDQRGVAAVVGGGVGVQPGDEDDAGDVTVQQQLDVLVLGHATRTLRTQHGRIALLGQRRLDRLGEGREDRIVQFGDDEPDQAG